MLKFLVRALAVVGAVALLLLVVLFVPGLLPEAQTQWSKVQPPRCAVAGDCVLANNSCCSNQSGNWTCAALDAKCAPNYAARVSGCWCGSGLCAANYSCEPLRPTATVELPPFPPEDLEPAASASPSASVTPSSSLAGGDCVLRMDSLSCCRGDSCSSVFINCVDGLVQRFKGCNEDCSPVWECVAEASPSPLPSA